VSLTLVDLLTEHWPSYASKHNEQLSFDHFRAVRSVLACRTAKLGGRLYDCEDCHTKHFAYHSCNHRSCPQCGALDQQIWTAKQEARLLPAEYFMVTFTIASELWPLCLYFPDELYDIILKQSAAALKDVIHTKTKGGKIGFTSVLHTWGRQLQHHPHVHCIVPAAALLTEGDKVIKPKKSDFLVHYSPLAERFRNLIHSALRDKHPDIYKNLSASQKKALSPITTWNVQLQHVGAGHTALRYLARYVKRSGFTNKRLIGYDATGKNVLLRWTPSGTKKSLIQKLSIEQFIRRWLLHVLPKGFARIRHYGYLSSAAKKTRLRIRLLLGELGEPAPNLPEPKAHCCPQCQGPLQFVREIARINPHRGPPL
jgi:hypothetical protein